MQHPVVIQFGLLMDWATQNLHGFIGKYLNFLSKRKMDFIGFYKRAKNWPFPDTIPLT